VEVLVAQLKLGPLTLGRQSQVEQRAAPRIEVRLPAKVVLGASMADCTIRDISVSGARVDAPSVLRLPDEVHLLILREGLLIHARRVWARFPLSGLNFVSAEEVAQSTHPEAALLRKACDDWTRSPRGRE